MGFAIFGDTTFDAVLSRIQLAVQDVRCARSPGETLYRECLATFMDRDGKMLSAGQFIPVFEQAGLLRFLDRHMLKLTLDALEADELLTLGCNLSAENFDDADSWHPVVTQISERRHLAHRLVLEVTESQEFSNLAFARAMLDQIKQMGCRVAIDDFGAGFATEDRLFSISADIVKLDASVVRGSAATAGAGKLDRMVGVARRAAPLVVVEGVETSAELSTAEMAGATHVQGYFLGRPRLAFEAVA